jgi:Spy/CpxP family protein refolding chaperone
VVNRAVFLAVSAIVALAGPVSAQRGETTGVGRQGARIGGRAAGVLPRKNAAANQQALTRQIRQRFDAVVRKQLNLSDDQARQLTAAEARFQPQRNQLQRDERQARLALREALQDSSGTPDQAKISRYMDQLVQAQHRRADLLEAEQKELGGFLTPLQRARYQGLHDQLNKRIQELRKKAGLPDPAVPR